MGGVSPAERLRETVEVSLNMFAHGCSSGCAKATS